MNRTFDKGRVDRNGLNYLRWQFIRRYMLGNESLREVQREVRVGMKEFLKWMREKVFVESLEAARQYRVLRDERLGEGKAVLPLPVALPLPLAAAERKSVEEKVEERAAEVRKIEEQTEREWIRAVRGEEGVRAFDLWVGREL